MNISPIQRKKTLHLFLINDFRENTHPWKINLLCGFDVFPWNLYELMLLSRYQNELPKKMKSRGKELYLTHDEIVMTIKWKLAVRKI